MSDEKILFGQPNHIVIDFDLKDDDGKSRYGVHQHYIYDGVGSKLKNLYSNGLANKKDSHF